MKSKEAEVLEKLVEIAKLKKELVELLVPAKTMKHLEVIGNEMKAMLLEALEGHLDRDSDRGSDRGAGESKSHESSVKKVDIE